MLGDVRLSRPIDWSVRAADYTPQHRFISYQSPRQFIFSIYERVDPNEDTWPDVLARYEKDVDDQGSDLLALRLPVATANAQGRSYIVRTKVPSKPDFNSYSHEILVRADNRILLVQIVHGENIESSADEMASAPGRASSSTLSRARPRRSSTSAGARRDRLRLHWPRRRSWALRAGR